MPEPGMVKCPSCGGTAKAGKFCMLCGASLPAAPTITVPGMPEIQQKCERKAIVNKAVVTPDVVRGSVEKIKLTLTAAAVDSGRIKRLEDVVLSLALNVFKFRICQPPDEISRMKTESLAITEFSTFHTPVYQVTVVHTKTGETRVVQIDSVTGQMRIR